MMMSSGLSQTPSSDNCIVPCSTLRNALIMNQELIMAQDKNRDLIETISWYNQEISQRDTLIMEKNKIIKTLESDTLVLRSQYNEEKKRADHYFNEWEKQRLYKWVGYGIAAITVFLSITK